MTNELCQWIISINRRHRVMTVNEGKIHRSCVYNLSNWEEILTHYRLNTLLSTGTVILNKLKYEIKFISVPGNEVNLENLTRRRRRSTGETEEGVGEGKG